MAQIGSYVTTEKKPTDKLNNQTCQIVEAIRKEVPSRR